MFKHEKSSAKYFLCIIIFARGRAGVDVGAYVQNVWSARASNILIISARLLDIFCLEIVTTTRTFPRVVLLANSAKTINYLAHVCLFSKELETNCRTNVLHILVTININSIYCTLVFT